MEFHGSRLTTRRRFVRLVRVRLVRLVRVRLVRVPVPSSRVRLVRASPHPEAGAGAEAGAGVGGGVIHVLLSHDSSFRPWEIEPARDDETKRNETKRNETRSRDDGATTVRDAGHGRRDRFGRVGDRVVDRVGDRGARETPRTSV